MNTLYKTSCVYNNYYGAVAYYSTSTSWDDSAVSGGGNINYTFFLITLTIILSIYVICIARQWLFQTCTELGNFATSDSTNQPFGNRFPLSFVTREVCTDVFSPYFNNQYISGAVDWTNVVNGGMDLTLNRTVFINGSIDPWSPLGMTTNKTGNLAIFINGIIEIQTDCKLLIYRLKMYILQELLTALICIPHPQKIAPR